MSIGLEVILIFVAGACLFGVAAMSMKARHRALTKRNQRREQRNFREENAAVSQLWN